MAIINIYQELVILPGLDNFVMILWDDDATIIPKESSHFGFYKLGQDNITEPLQV